MSRFDVVQSSPGQLRTTTALPQSAFTSRRCCHLVRKTVDERFCYPILRPKPLALILRTTEDITAYQVSPPDHSSSLSLRAAPGEDVAFWEDLANLWLLHQTPGSLRSIQEMCYVSRMLKPSPLWRAD